MEKTLNKKEGKRNSKFDVIFKFFFLPLFIILLVVVFFFILSPLDNNTIQKDAGKKCGYNKDCGSGYCVYEIIKREKNKTFPETIDCQGNCVGKCSDKDIMLSCHELFMYYVIKDGNVKNIACMHD